MIIIMVLLLNYTFFLRTGSSVSRIALFNIVKNYGRRQTMFFPGKFNFTVLDVVTRGRTWLVLAVRRVEVKNSADRGKYSVLKYCS